VKAADEVRTFATAKPMGLDAWFQSVGLALYIRLLVGGCDHTLVIERLGWTEMVVASSRVIRDGSIQEFETYYVNFNSKQS
jgi:hypothetical protein